jgi:cytochrome c-type biogenesis protein CcmH/NrfG
LPSALNELPPYYRAAKLVQRAETLAALGQDKSAVGFFTNALEITPSSRRARLGIALSYFRSPDDEDHKKGLEALQGLALEKDEWDKLSAVMPAAYRSLFTDVEK